MKRSEERRYIAAVACVLAVYFAMAAATVPRLAPYIDEGFFAAPPWALLHRGHFGSLTLEPCAYPLLRETPAAAVPRIDHRNYINMPLHGVLQAGWYQLTGFSLESMRWLSVLWGAVYLAAVAGLGILLTGSRWAGVGAMAVVAVDPAFFLWACRGRMDVMAAALGFSGLTLYLYWRPERLPLGLLAGNLGVAAAGMTHPMGGITALAALTVTAVILDGRRLVSGRIVLPVLLPYLAMGFGWGWYILQDPSSFVAQFGATLGSRTSGGAPFWELPWRELVERWMPAYGYRGQLGMWKLVALAGYLAALLYTVARWRQFEKGVRLLAVVTLLQAAALGLMDSYRQEPYTVYALGPLAALTAFHAVRGPRWLPVLAGLVFVLELSGTIRLVSQNRRANWYAPTVEFVKHHNPERRPVVGSSELGFGLGFDGVLRDDFRLGFCSGRQPEWIVASQAYQNGWRNLARVEPQAGRYVADLLEHHYQVVRQDQSYTIYRRKPN